MVSIQQRFLATVLLTAMAGQAEVRPKFYADDPVRQELPPKAVTNAARRSIDDIYDFAFHTFATPGAVEEENEEGRHRPSADVNTLGEVLEGEWYNMRHYRQRMSLEELVRGPGNSTPPAEGVWRVVAAKTDGVTPGFTVEDPRGERYLLKFDPPDYPELASSADIVGSKLFHALGYWTPENYIVRFPISRLTVDPSAKVENSEGRLVPLSMGRVKRMLREQRKDERGEYRALASRLLPGKPLGPYRYSGLRTDDPNDLVPHHERRSLRGLAVFAAWFNHTDARSINSLDMLTEVGGAPHIRHYLIDFGSSMGSDSIIAKEASRGHIYDVEPKYLGLQVITLGLVAPDWQRVRIPRLRGVGRFESKTFRAREWKPAYPNPAFSRMDESDAFWAARQVAAFTNPEIEALVSTAEFSDPRAAAYVTKVLIERRDKIAEAYLQGALAIDRFRVEGGALRFDELTKGQPARGLAWSEFDNGTGQSSPLREASGWVVPESASRYLRAEIQDANREACTIHVYLRRASETWEVVGVDRRYPAPGEKARAKAASASQNALLNKGEQ